AKVGRAKKLLEEARLAHAGLADHGEHPGALPRSHLPPQPVNLAQFGPATDVRCMNAQGIEATGRPCALRDAPQAHPPGQSAKPAGSLVATFEPSVDQTPGG